MENAKVAALYGASGLVGEKESAEILGVTPGTLQVWRSAGRYAIPFVKVGRLVRCRRCILESWLDSHARVSGVTV